MSQPIKTSVVGSGLAARVFHVPLVLAHPSLFQLYSVVERSPPNDKPEGTIAHAFNIKTKLVNRYEDATNDPEVELVRQRQSDANRWGVVWRLSRGANRLSLERLPRLTMR